MTLRKEQEKVAMLPFSRTAESVIQHSRNEARKHRNSYLSTDHLALGLVQAALKNGETIAEFFHVLGVDKLSLWNEAVKKVSNGSSAVENLTETPLYTKVLKWAAEEAQRSGDTETRPIHILIGFIRQEVSITNSSYPSLITRGKPQIDTLRMLTRNRYYLGRCKDEDKYFGKK
jgi:ATP-dependent Clp protease ATP-binding subunit ClpA